MKHWPLFFMTVVALFSFSYLQSSTSDVPQLVALSVGNAVLAFVVVYGSLLTLAPLFKLKIKLS